MPDAAATNASATDAKGAAAGDLLTGNAGAAGQANAGDAAAKATADAASAKAASDAAAAAAAKPVIPEKYEFKKPEKGALSADDESDLVAEAKLLGLTGDAAQKFYDHRLSQLTEATKSMLAEQTRMQQEWRTQLQNDPEVGQANFEKSKLNANRALASFDDKDRSMAKFLAVEGMANHPTIYKFLARMGASMGEDKVVTGNAPTTSKPGERSFEETANRLYPSLVKKT